MRPTKNSKIVAFWRDTMTDPYQNTKAITKNVSACVKAYNRLLHIAVLLDLLNGSSKLWLYTLRQSSSLVNAATVRIEDAASQAT